MDFLQESHSSDGFDGRSEAYINAAEKAVRENHKKLAIHLYIAAFEQENVDNVIPSQAVLDGMSTAWDIACEIGDKSSAEIIFMQLSPYSSPEQVQKRVKQLQEMAVNQLKEMGVPDDCIDRISPANEAIALPDDIDPEDYIEALQLDDEVEGSTAASHGKIESGSANPMDIIKQLGGVVAPKFEFKKFKNLVGYDAELKQMCVYGFESAGDQDFRRFIKENSEFHGIEEMSLLDPFVIQGPSREDLYEFAQATAGEIANPIVTLHVRTDDEGIWTMRLSGPFKKGIFGMADPSDVPTPCTFIIENIDLLQEFMKVTMHNEFDYEDDIVFSHSASRGYGEVLSYIYTMMNKPGVFTIATSAKNDIEFLPQFGDLFATAQTIDVGYPNIEERKEIWRLFAGEHASFATINLDALSEISAGVSRHDLVIAGRNAVRDAYRKSISNKNFEFVDIKDVLYELVPFVSDEKLGQSIEDAAAKAFSCELEGFLSDIDE